MSELEDSDDPALARIWTDADGRIWQMNEPATRLFNIVNPNRRLITIFFGDNRDRLAVLLGEAANGHVGSVDRVILRPRERRPIPVRIRLNREEDSAFVLWTIVPHLD